MKMATLRWATIPDSTTELEPDTGVAILSLGAERTISYKSIQDRKIIKEYCLKSGSLLYMNQHVQHNWLHAIPKEKSIGGRISLTFRRIMKA